jgi:hypothetical protein
MTKGKSLQLWNSIVVPEIIAKGKSMMSGKEYCVRKKS